MPEAISELERTIILTARKYLDSEELPWCEHWLYGKMTNDCRLAHTIVPDEGKVIKAIMKLVKKKYVKIDWSDRYVLIVEATRLIK